MSVRIVDVSSNNGPVNWKKVHASGVVGVQVKATEGATYTSPGWYSQASAARAAGMRVGLYHFARPDHNHAAVEAAHFCKTVRALKPGDLKPTLDFETASLLSPADAFTWIVQFNNLVKNDLGAWPLFYSFSAFVHALRLPRPVGNGLWLADYGPDDGQRHPVEAPAPWKKVALPPYTSKGSVPGMDGRVDVSYAASLDGLLVPVEV